MVYSQTMLFSKRFSAQIQSAPSRGTSIRCVQTLWCVGGNRLPLAGGIEGLVAEGAVPEDRNSHDRGVRVGFHVGINAKIWPTKLKKWSTRGGGQYYHPSLGMRQKACFNQRLNKALCYYSILATKPTFHVKTADFNVGKTVVSYLGHASESSGQPRNIQPSIQVTIRVAATPVSLVLFVLIAHVHSARPLLLLFTNDAVIKKIVKMKRSWGILAAVLPEMPPRLSFFKSRTQA